MIIGTVCKTSLTRYDRHERYLLRTIGKTLAFRYGFTSYRDNIIRINYFKHNYTRSRTFILQYLHAAHTFAHKRDNIV